MKKLILFGLSIMLNVGCLFAQNDFLSVLNEIEKNNTTLEAWRQRTDAGKLSSKTGIYLQNPEVGFNYLWGSPDEIGNRTDFSVMQSFDFPSAYRYKKNIAELEVNQALTQLDKAYEAGDFESLFSMSHILHVKNLEPGEVTVSSIITDEDLAEEFGWDGDLDGYSYFVDGEEESAEEEEFISRTFLTTLKRRVYGNLNVDFPVYLLEELEEIEMADYDLESLDGIEACKYAKAIDLTNNNLTDLSELGYLRQVERLYLSNNHIGMIESLSNLVVLQILDLSSNDLDDLSPLFDLTHLNYLNVMGNRVPDWQLEKLQKKGVTVVH